MSKDSSVSTGSSNNDSYCSSDHGGFDTCTPIGETEKTGEKDSNDKSDYPT
ncbi:hypothetical protein [Candidatus Tisiphia endosymbiont of Beris chalybata]|uniref:hypothetical protein n=1 Tax=Candidatus Tisiphia endosymbiont of Beris chalybata TaxID=3066262 RepID=UPI00312CBCC2